nr:16S rRNA (cytosine(967)-C(5))-methyltransferase RsmB [Chthoniobacterales bacterium]
ELFYGVLRNLTLLDFWIGLLRPASIDHRSRDLLRVGLYQLLCLRTPSHAAVFETVELSTRRQRPFINAVLRAALRRLPELETAAHAEPLATRFSHPEFLVKKWGATYGSQAATQLCEWNNQPPPIYARLNRLRTTVETFLAEHPSVVQLSENTNFVRLQSLPEEALARGDCYIQDPSTSLACELLDPQPGERVLDACAAPGGKSGLVAELMDNGGQVIACDRDSSRLETLRQNLARLGVTSAQVVLQNWTANELSPEFLPGPFDRILVDAPCTNTGVMRRRVDVRWRLRSEDFRRMQTEQLAILRRVVPLLRPGGVLVYSTCSIEAEENERVVERVLEHFPSLLLNAQKSIVPFRNRFDGAFGAKLTHIG